MASVLERAASTPKRQDSPEDNITSVGNDDQCVRTLDDESPTTPLTHKLIVTAAVVGPFIGVVVGIVLAWQFSMMSWLYLTLLLSGWLLTGLGITIGYHRLITHRSFETYPWIKTCWTALGSLAIEGSPLVWSAVHRKHHQHSDQEGDPHSPHLHGSSWLGTVRGFFHSHMGWLFHATWTDSMLQRYVPDLFAQPVMVRVHRRYLWWVLASFAIPAIIAGLVTLSWTGAFLGFVWGGAVRVFFTHHVTWSINSICHVFGRRDFRAGDDSRNNWLFGLLGHGEGWHNNHHAFPTSARHGLFWWQVDFSWYVIRTMQFLGLAWDVRTPSSAAMATRRLT